MDARSSLLAVILLAAVTFPLALIAGGRDDILGSWYNAEKDAQIEIVRCGEKYCGYVVWLKEPNYPEGSRDGAAGTPRLDSNNPEPALRTAPVLGLQIVRDFSYARENSWTGGRVYDPKNGKSYQGKMTLVSPNRLNLRGYVGIPLFGRTTNWTR
jgi:uncharacterized protein (DUF2147 family)